MPHFSRGSRETPGILLKTRWLIPAAERRSSTAWDASPGSRMHGQAPHCIAPRNAAMVSTRLGAQMPMSGAMFSCPGMNAVRKPVDHAAQLRICERPARADHCQAAGRRMPDDRIAEQMTEGRAGFGGHLSANADGAVFFENAVLVECMQRCCFPRRWKRGRPGPRIVERKSGANPDVVEPQGRMP